MPGGTTNVIESPQNGVQKRTNNVTRWLDAATVERWVASARLLTESIFGRSSAIGISGLSPSFSEEKKLLKFPKKWCNRNLSAALTCNCGWDTLLGTYYGPL
jgi:hypothetical protein